MIADKFLRGLHKVRETGDSSWIACCPVHNDKHPSLSIKETLNASGELCLLLHCFACNASGVDVAEALGLKARDLFPEKLNYDHTKKQKRQYFPAEDVLECIYHDALTIEIIARHVEPDKRMSEIAIQQLSEARHGIEQAVTYIRQKN